MEATVAERGQITLPKQVREALGLAKGSKLRVELEGGRIVLRKDVSDAISRLRGRIKLPPGVSSDDIMRGLRGRTPGDAYPAPVDEPGLSTLANTQAGANGMRSTRSKPSTKPSR